MRAPRPPSPLGGVPRAPSGRSRPSRLATAQEARARRQGPVCTAAGRPGDGVGTGSGPPTGWSGLSPRAGRASGGASVPGVSRGRPPARGVGAASSPPPAPRRPGAGLPARGSGLRGGGAPGAAEERTKGSPAPSRGRPAAANQRCRCRRRPLIGYTAANGAPAPPVGAAPRGAVRWRPRAGRVDAGRAPETRWLPASPAPLPRPPRRGPPALRVPESPLPPRRCLISP